MYLTLYSSVVPPSRDERYRHGFPSGPYSWQSEVLYPFSSPSWNVPGSPLRMVWYSPPSWTTAASCNLLEQTIFSSISTLVSCSSFNNNDNITDYSHQPGCSSTAASLPCLPRLLLFPPPPPPPPPPLSSFVFVRHFLILHFFLWMVSGQALPPSCGSSLTIRVRMVCPLPQDLLHSDHSDHSETMQSTAGRRTDRRRGTWGNVRKRTSKGEADN